MKGIMLISFKKSPGAYVEREFPKGISDQMKITPSDIMTYYSLHRMRNMKPNYLYAKVKGLMIASFYSGFNFKDYIGDPDKCISIILDNENPNSFEGQLVRLGHELLPLFKEVNPDVSMIDVNSKEYKEKSEDFDDLLEKSYWDLMNKEIKPMDWEEAEIIVDGGSTISTTDGTHTGHLPGVQKVNGKSKEEIKQQNKDDVSEISNMGNMLEEMEKEGLRDEIRNLHQMMKDKDEKIRDLEQNIEQSLKNAAESSSNRVNEETLRRIEEMGHMLQAKEDELTTWREKIAEMNEKMFINQDTITKMTEMSMMQSDEMQEQARKIKNLKDELKEKDERLEIIQKELEKANEDKQKLDSALKELEHVKMKQKYIDMAEDSKASPRGFTITQVNDEQNMGELIKTQQELEEEKEARKELQQKIGEYKSQIIELKKNVKIQRREIESLKEKIESNDLWNES